MLIRRAAGGASCCRVFRLFFSNLTMLGSILIAVDNAPCATIDQVSIGGQLFQRHVFDPTNDPLSGRFTDAVFLASGDLAVTWSRSLAPSFQQVFTRAFDISGTALTPETLVFSDRSARFPRLSARPDGSYALVLQDSVGSSSHGVTGMTASASGSLLSGPYQVSTSTPANMPQAETYTNGDFLVVWHSVDVYARKYNSDGTPATAPFVVNSNTTDDQTFPNLDMIPSGEAIVVWQNHDGVSGTIDIAAQKLDASGGLLGGEVAITATSITELNPNVAMDSAGNSVIVWRAGDDLIARQYDSTLVPTGPVFQINQPTSGGSRSPDIDMRPDGSFAVAWYDEGKPGSILLRMFDSNGSPLGDEYLVNPNLAIEATWPHVSFGPDGSFAISWYDRAPNTPGELPGFLARVAIFTPVPEPSSLVLTALGLMFLGLLKNRTYGMRFIHGRT